MEEKRRKRRRKRSRKGGGMERRGGVEGGEVGRGRAVPEGDPKIHSLFVKAENEG